MGIIYMLLFVSLVGAIINIAIGSVWHNDKISVFGKLHMKYIGFYKLSKEEREAKIKSAMPNMWKVLGLQFVLSFMMSFFIAASVFLLVINFGGLRAVNIYLVFVWLGIVLPIVGTNLLWGQCEDKKILWQKFVSDALYHIINILVIASVANFIFLNY